MPVDCPLRSRPRAQVQRISAVFAQLVTLLEQEMHAADVAAVEEADDAKGGAALRRDSFAKGGAGESDEAVSEEATPRPVLDLQVDVHGPLLVVPSPSLPRAAVVIRLGSLFVAVETHEAEGGEAPYERCVAMLCGTQLLISSTGDAINGDGTLQRDASPHWLLKGIDLNITVDHVLPMPAPSAHATAARASAPEGPDKGAAEAARRMEAAALAALGM